MLYDLVALLAFTSPGLGLMNLLQAGQQLNFLPQCWFVLVLSGLGTMSLPCNGEQPIQAAGCQGGAQPCVPLTSHWLEGFWAFQMGTCMGTCATGTGKEGS